MAPGWGGGDSDSGGDGGDDGGGPCTKYSRPDLWKRTDGDSRGLGPMMVEAASMESAPCWVTGAEGSNPALARGTADGGVISGESGGWRGEGGVVGGGEGVGEGGGRGSRFQGGGLAKSSSESVAVGAAVRAVHCRGGVTGRARVSPRRARRDRALCISATASVDAADNRDAVSDGVSCRAVCCTVVTGLSTTTTFSTRVPSILQNCLRTKPVGSKFPPWIRAAHAVSGCIIPSRVALRRRAFTWTSAWQRGSPQYVTSLFSLVTFCAVAHDLPEPIPGSWALRVGCAPRAVRL